MYNHRPETRFGVDRPSSAIQFFAVLSLSLMALTYARRVAPQIDSEENFTIVGVSFGGMLALELNKLLNPNLIVLISSAVGPQDNPRTYRLLERPVYSDGFPISS